ncbi:hypothetical protein ACLOAV_003770 [Pseudogymnoascus australis]
MRCYRLSIRCIVNELYTLPLTLPLVVSLWHFRGLETRELLDAVTLAEHITSPAYDRSSPTSLDVYVKENIERRQHERYRSYLLQKVMFSGQNRIMGFVRDKTLPLALRRIDDLDREEHNVDETWVAKSGEDPQWVEELRWEGIYDEQHGRERNGGS